MDERAKKNLKEEFLSNDVQDMKVSFFIDIILWLHSHSYLKTALKFGQ